MAECHPLTASTGTKALANGSPSHQKVMLHYGVPNFIKSPEDQIGISGGVASFVCQAGGDPKPRITWMKKGKKVSSQRFEVIEFDDGSGSVLRIQPLRTHRDEAIYECTATNGAGEINTSAKLTVLEAAIAVRRLLAFRLYRVTGRMADVLRIYTSDPSSQRLQENQVPHGFPSIDMGPQLKVVERTRTATMLCAASGNPDPEITWYKDMLPVDINSSNGRIKQLRSGALQIENSEESDQGKYECVALNSAGTRYSAPANLYVRVRRVPPRFSIPPTNHEVMPGGSVNLTCVAVGSPMPYVKWTMGETDLTKEEEMPVGRNVLEVTNIRESANYTCVAMSSLGMIEATAQVTVKALPKPPTSVTVTETTATSVTLTWDSGNPEPVSYYMIQYRAKAADGGFQEVDGVATTRYSIGGLSPYSEYEFRVMALNNVGRGPPGDPVETRTGEQAPSSPPLRVQARMLSASTMLVQWEPPEEPNGQVRGYRVYYSSDSAAPLSAWQKHNTDDSRLTTISGLITDITYSLRVLGFTSVGDGPPSDVLQVKTQQGVPAQPSSFEAEAELDTRIMLTWLWPVQDPITKYELQYWEADSDNKPDTLYRFSLAARSEMGLGVFTQPIEARTAQSCPRPGPAPLPFAVKAPSAPPQEVHLVSLTSTSLKVSWVAPPAASRHGAIVRYTVGYQAPAGEDTERREVTGIAADATSQVLEQLEKWTEYQVWVRAHTDVGPGPESAAVRIRTKEDVPGAPPKKLEVTAVNSTAIRVTWKPPMQGKQHGQIRGYQVIFSRLENDEPRGQPNIMDVALPEAQEAIIGGLHAETTYSVTVAAYTTKGDGARSKAKVITTTGAVPGKPTMMISTTIGNTALIQWQPPKEMVGELMGYLLQYKRTEDEAFTSRELRGTDDHYTVTGLHRGATYVFRLSAKNRAGAGEAYVKEIGTQEDAPSGFPLNLRVTGLTTTSTQLAWEPPALAERNGRMTHYAVVYRDINSQQNSTNRTAETRMTIQGLKPDTTYDIRIQAFTGKGPGPLSPSIQSRTMSTSPAFATSFGVKAVMKTSVLLTWEVPENYKSQVPFKILYNQQSVEVQGNLKRRLITRLQPDTDYSFVLMSRGNSAGGLQQQVSIRTSPDLFKSKAVLFSQQQAQGGRLTIDLPRVQTTAQVGLYYIAVVPVSPSTQRWENPDEMDLDELLEASDGPVAKRRTQPDAGRPYIAAMLTSLPATFTLGDEKRYSGFLNKPLPGHQEYICFVVAGLHEQETDASDKYRTFSTSPYSDPMSPRTEQPEMLWVMGPVLAVVLIIIIVIAILLFKRKRASPLPKDDHSGGVKDTLLPNSSDPVELRRLNYQTPGPSSHHSPNTPRMREHPPISVSDLADHIERLKANDNLRFSQEYE
ncbi:hypothetical protein NHX12_004341, partial [Muraenolepis orangiensis]